MDFLRPGQPGVQPRPRDVRKHLGIGAPDRLTFVIDETGVHLESATLTLESLFGSVPPLPGRDSVNFEDQIEEAMAHTARTLFRAVERGEEEVTTTEVVLHEIVYILTSKKHYSRPPAEIAAGPSPAKPGPVSNPSMRPPASTVLPPLPGSI